MLQRKPKNHTIVDMYKAWCAEILQDPNYYSEHDATVRRWGIRVIFQKVNTPTVINKEVVKGEFDGINRVFQTAHKHWVKDSLVVYKNGKVQTNTPGDPNKDYYSVPLNQVIMMTTPPKATDMITVNYQYYEHEMVMSYTMFRLTTEAYNRYGCEFLIRGDKFELGSNLGYLFPARIERNFRNPKVDVVATVNIRKKDPTHPAVYYTSPDYCMIKWHKNYRTRNETVYTFVTAERGFRKDFSKSNRENPLLQVKYKYYPVQLKQSA
jgi:hypothetical protein